jgi:hypothetical protein
VRDHLEDRGTILYLRDCAVQAGVESRIIDIEDIGLSSEGHFTDLDDNVIRAKKNISLLRDTKVSMSVIEFKLWWARGVTTLVTIQPLIDSPLAFGLIACQFRLTFRNVMKLNELVAQISRHKTE